MKADSGTDAASNLQVRVGEARLGRRGRLGRVGRARDGGGLRDRRHERAGAAEGEGGDDSLHVFCFFFLRAGVKLGSCVPSMAGPMRDPAARASSENG